MLYKAIPAKNQKDIKKDKRFQNYNVLEACKLPKKSKLPFYGKISIEDFFK